MQQQSNAKHRPMHRALALVAPAVAGLALAIPASAAAAPTLGQLEGQWWSQQLAVPRNPNPPRDPCPNLGDGIVAPTPGSNCVVAPGTQIFIVGSTAECDNAEPRPFYGATYAQQVACGRRWVSGAKVSFTIDGQPITGAEAITPPESIVLPPDNIDGVPAGPITFAADGWVALTPPLAAGTHTLTDEGVLPLPGGQYTFDESYTVQVAPASQAS